VKRTPTFSALVQTKVESLICHLHGYGKLDLARDEWEALRTFASFLFREVEEDAGCADRKKMREAVCRYVVAQGPHLSASWKAFFAEEFNLREDEGNPYRHLVLVDEP